MKFCLQFILVAIEFEVGVFFASCIKLQM